MCDQLRLLEDDAPFKPLQTVIGSLQSERNCQHLKGAAHREKFAFAMSESQTG